MLLEIMQDYRLLEVGLIGNQSSDKTHFAGLTNDKEEYAYWH